MNLSKLGVNPQLLKDAVIASVVVQQAPQLLEKFWDGYSTQSDMIKKVAQAGAGWLVGYVMKNKNIQTLALALAVSDLVSDTVGDVVANFLPDGAPATPPESSAYGGNMQDYMRLSEYINAPEVSRDYAKFYN